MTIEDIRWHHRTRCFAIEQRKRVDLSLGCFLRTALGWSLALPEVERAAIARQAAAIAKEPPVEWANIVSASNLTKEPWVAMEKAAEKEMIRLVKSLSVWGDWAEPIPGVGALSLAIIIGEAGDIGAYRSEACLWKRMGLAVLDGVRQGGLHKTAAKEDWIVHGYNRQRRSRMWTIGDSLVKAAGPYREIYLYRKEIERAKALANGLTVAPSAKIPKARAGEFMSDGHIHRRAQRYMEKRVLRHLWRKWRARSNMPMEAKGDLPATSINQIREWPS